MSTATQSPVKTVRILIADKLAPAGVEFLKQSKGVEVDIKTGLSEEELAQIVGDYDGMAVRSGAQVTAKVLARPGRLKAIVRAGVGVDNIDLDAATRAGILVMNSAEASTITTAEHAFTLMMALARNVGPAYRRMAEGGWDRNKFVGRQLHGKTAGVVGFGRIGRTFAERALAFGMQVLAFDPVFNAETALDGKVRLVRTFEELVSQVDFLSFHVPLNDHTRQMLNRDTLAKARKGIMVINAARGGVIDNEALLEAVNSGQCGGAAIDVFEVEPPPADDPIRKSPRVLVTPHLGASTEEAQEAVSNHACEQLLEYLMGQGIRGAVNASGVRLDLSPDQIRFVDLAQRMARLIGPMCESGIAEVTVSCHGQVLAGAASTIERMALVDLLSTQLDEPINVVNASVFAADRGIKVRNVVESDPAKTPRLIIEVISGEETRRIVGAVFADGLPRILEINGYHMDMVPTGPMAVLQNEDRPGMIGMVGSAFGESGTNIADMALSRRGKTALMMLKLDEAPPEALVKQLRSKPGILKVLPIMLPKRA